MNHQNNIDVYFKTEIENATMPFDKEKGWSRLEKKKKQKRIVQISSVSASIAAATFIGFIVLFSNKFQVKPTITDEFEKRQILERYEQIMSGTYHEEYLCIDCDGYFLPEPKQELPKNYWFNFIN